MEYKKLIIGNWKMNPESLKVAKGIVNSIKKEALTAKNVMTVLCPPDIYLSEINRMFRSDKLKLGAQDAYFEKVGAYTGQISPLMLRGAGASYLIIGHSERRAAGDTDEMINKKVKMALALGFTIILCVGEKQRDEHGFYLSAVQDQLTAGLKGVQKKDSGRIVIAYEPVWAIGKDAARAAEPEEIEQMMLYIRKVLASVLSKTGNKVRTLYGGSVDMKGATALLSISHVDGLLVGRESLNPKNFSEIIRIASNAAHA
ncbi:MAG: triose-phosphate isomerase [Candidatus Paceibacterota bacterium]|jgi:triosephosphate isomerase